MHVVVTNDAKIVVEYHKVSNCNYIRNRYLSLFVVITNNKCRKHL